ncbi:DUF3298 and DUF4163 domain-containing protein [uncultured Gelidibacter sp.]|uniref:DUF3298 and DUF4163 domain-containing protein n=1 Tax=uncultured Gelidibacter sp. TaxID=259318 RepID=UPI0026153435|nr:DUF3298 and DUF4163 domain-containing protein [uncultured Gelidibacter sp.]
MFNKSSETLKKISYFLLIAFTVFACNEDVKLNFETQHIEKSSDAVIVINYPKAIGTKAVAEKINQKIEHVIANEMNMAETTENNISVKEAVSMFDNEYKSFKKDFQDSSQKWEVKVDGSVMYESAEVVCISLKSYIDTGGAHGNSRLTYLNFNPETGALLDQDDIINNASDFKTLAEKAFKAQTKPEDDTETIEDFFYGEDFQLPANMGFTKDGLVLLYNNYEIASYAQGVTKVVLPYEDVKGLLKINP